MTAGVGVAAGMTTRRRRRGFALGLAIGAAVPLLLAVASFFAGSSSPSTPSTPPDSLDAERAAFTRYEDALEPLIQEGAGVVVYGMRPGVSDIADGIFEDEVLVDMASGWVGSMESLRDDFAAVDAPPFLSSVAERFDASLRAYVETAEALLRAARATGEERAAAIEEVGTLGRRADGLFDEARAMLDEERARLGLGQDAAQRSAPPSSPDGSPRAG